MVVVSSYPPQRCGIGHYTRDLIKTLLQRHLEDEFFILAEKRSWIPFNIKEGGRMQIWRVWDRRSLNYPFQIVRAVCKINPDVILIQHEYGLYGSYGGFLFPLLLLLLYMFGFPVFMTMHTVCPKRLYLDKLRKSLRYSKRTLFWRRIDVKLTTFFVKRLVKRVIVHSKGLASQIIDNYGFSREKIVTIPHGSTTFKPIDKLKAKKRLKLTNKQIILSFGFLSYRKGYENVIYALHDLSKKFPDLIYVIAGTHQSTSGERYLKELKALIRKLNVEKHVFFLTKQIPVEEFPVLFSAADILVLPYIDLFGDSGVLRQAAGFGKAVIASSIGTFKEEIEDGVDGLLVPPSNPEQIRLKLAYLLEKPKKGKKMGEKLREKALQHWEWTKVSKKVYEIANTISD